MKEYSSVYSINWTPIISTSFQIIKLKNRVTLGAKKAGAVGPCLSSSGPHCAVN
jgi:hypothetical protein